MAERSDLSSKVAEDAVPLSMPPSGGGDVQMTADTASYRTSGRDIPRYPGQSSQPQSRGLPTYSQSAPGGPPQRSVLSSHGPGIPSQHQGPPSRLPASRADQQQQGRNIGVVHGSSTLGGPLSRGGHSQPDLSPAQGFPELSLPAASPPGGSLPRDGASRGTDDYQTDVLKGVSQALQKSLGDDADCVKKNLPSPSSSEVKSLSVVPVEGTLFSDEDIEKYRHMMPKDLKIDYYDAMILYQEDDRSAVDTFLRRVNTEVMLLKVHKPRLALYDEIVPDLGMSQVGQLDLVLPYCTYVLLYVTKEFCTDAWSEFSSQACLMNAIDNPDCRWSVVPIFTQSKRERTFKIPASVRSLKGIQYWSDDKFYVDSLRKLLEDKVQVRLKKEKEHRAKRLAWIRRQKDREVFEAQMAEQEQAHAEEEAKLKRERHERQMQARDKAFQQRKDEQSRQLQGEIDPDAKNYAGQFCQQPLPRLPRPFPSLHNYETYAAQCPYLYNTQNDPNFSYMNYVFQQAHNPYGNIPLCLPPKQASVPSQLNQFGNPHPSPSLHHSYSSPSPKTSLPDSSQSRQDPEKLSSSLPAQFTGAHNLTPMGSKDSPTSQGDPGYPQAVWVPEMQGSQSLQPPGRVKGHPQNNQEANSGQGLQSSQQASQTQSDSKYAGAEYLRRENFPQSQKAGDGEDFGSAGKELEAASIPVTQSLSLSQGQGKGSSFVETVQQHLAGVNLTESQQDKQKTLSSFDGGSPVTSHSEKDRETVPAKSDLEGDNPPDSFLPHQGQGLPPRWGFVQPSFSEAVEEPMLVAHGPAHHADHRTRAEPADRGSHRGNSQQYLPAGYGGLNPMVGAHGFNLTQPFPHGPRPPYVSQQGQGGFLYPGGYPVQGGYQSRVGYNPQQQQQQQYHHQHPAPQPPSHHRNAGFSAADTHAQQLYRPELYAARHPQFEGPASEPSPAPQPLGQPHPHHPHSHPEQQRPAVVHYHYYNQGESASRAPINIQNAENVIVGSEVHFTKKTRSRRGDGGDFRSDEQIYAQTEDPGESYESPQSGPAYSSDPPSYTSHTQEQQSRLTEHTEHNPGSRLTDAVTADRSRQSWVSSSGHQTAELQEHVQTAFRDLPTSDPQPHDYESSWESQTLCQHGAGVEQWHRQYEEEQETALKEYDDGPPDGDGTRDEGDETSLKSQSTSPSH